MINIREITNGVIIPVTVRTKGKRNEVAGIYAGSLKVTVTVAREKGKANRAVSELLAKFFDVSKNQVQIVLGETSREKTFQIEGVNRDEVFARITPEG